MSWKRLTKAEREEIVGRLLDEYTYGLQGEDPEEVEEWLAEHDPTFIDDIAKAAFSALKEVGGPDEFTKRERATILAEQALFLMFELDESVYLIGSANVLDILEVAGLSFERLGAPEPVGWYEAVPD